MPARIVTVVAPAQSSIDRGGFLARWLSGVILLLFAGPFAVALIVVGLWYLIPSANGRGRDLVPLVVIAVGGCAGLAGWSLLSGRSPVEDGLAAQVMLARALVVGSNG